MRVLLDGSVNRNSFEEGNKIEKKCPKEKEKEKTALIVVDMPVIWKMIDVSK